MSTVSDEPDAESVFELSPSERRSQLGQFRFAVCVFFILAVGFLIFGFWSLGKEDWGYYRIVNAAFLIVCAMAMLYELAKITGRYRYMNSYSGRFIVSADSIRWVTPDGLTRFARWSDLRFIKPSAPILYFGDGTVILLRFAPNKMATEEKELLNRLVQASGPQPFLQDALAEQKLLKNPPTREKVISGIVSVLTTATMLTYVFLVRFAEIPRDAKVWGIVGIFWLGIGLASVSRLQRYRRIVSRFHPPRRERSRFQKI